MAYFWVISIFLIFIPQVISIFIHQHLKLSSIIQAQMTLILLYY